MMVFAQEKLCFTLWAVLFFLTWKMSLSINVDQILEICLKIKLLTCIDSYFTTKVISHAILLITESMTILKQEHLFSIRVHLEILKFMFASGTVEVFITQHPATVALLLRKEAI